MGAVLEPSIPFGYRRMWPPVYGVGPTSWLDSRLDTPITHLGRKLSG